MFTRDFRKPLLTISAVLTAGLLYGCIMLALQGLSRWAEQDLDAYPFKQEDWLRYLLPSRFVLQERDRIMLAGPSTVRENLLYKRFEEEFPEYFIYQGGISLGAMDDLLASLEYVEQVYGDGALPEILVLGVAPRFIANIPDDRPFSIGLNKYSPYFAIGRDASGVRLVRKNFFGGMLARARFLAWKQPKRSRTALLALLNHWMYEKRSAAEGPGMPVASGSRELSPVDRIFKIPAVSELVRLVGFKRILDYNFSELLAWHISPYKYSLNPPMNLDGMLSWMNHPDSWWRLVYTWNPVQTQQETAGRLNRLVGFADRHDIRLLVINMPDRDLSRVKFDAENYQAYMDLLTDTFGASAVLDLREFLRSEEFYDSEHSMPAGSLRLTDVVIEHMKTTMMQQDSDRKRVPREQAEWQPE